MDEIVYDSLSRYFSTLEKTGYMSYDNVYKLLVLNFYKDFIEHDYRGLITREDYLLIEQALNCLFGTSCLIPYPDYLKMGKLHLGEMSELACRIKELEDTNVLKLIQGANTITNSNMQSDVDVIVDD